MSNFQLSFSKIVIVFGMILLLTGGLSGCLESSIESRTISVNKAGGADFRTIQEALNVADNGDTIVVYAGVYFERLIINKSVDLIGENKQTTNIDGRNGVATGSESVVIINADGCSLQKFTILGVTGALGVIGLTLNASNTTVSENIIMDSYRGVVLDEGTEENVVSWNTFANNTQGVFTEGISESNVSYNEFVMNDQYGIYFTRSDDNVIMCNNLSHNDDYGIRIKGSDSNLVIGNRMVGNRKGLLFCCGATQNQAYYNIFLENSEYNARDDIANIWDDGEKGNFWDDYLEKYPQAFEINGVWNIPYNISSPYLEEENRDRYPLSSPFSPCSS